MKQTATVAIMLMSIAFLFFMSLAAPRGQILATRTPPSARMIEDRFAHYHYTNHALCDLGHLIGLCGDVGSLTTRGV